MNVLLVSVDALPHVGGVSLTAHHLANAFTRAGHDVVLLGPRGTFVPGDLTRDYLICEDWESQTARRAGPDSLVEDARIGSLVRAMFARYRTDRAILVHAFYYGPGVVEACRASGVACSVMFHGLELRSQLSGGYPAAAPGPDDRRAESLPSRTFRVIAECDELLANSHFTAGLLVPFPARPPIRVMGCGIEEAERAAAAARVPRYAAADKRARRQRVGLTRHATIGFVGRLVANKRVDRLIDLVAADSRLAAVVIGDGPLAAPLRVQATTIGVGDRVHFAGSVSTDHKWRLLEACDALALLSDNDPVKGSIEGFGIALLEGIAAGCLPVTSGTGGMVDIVTQPDGNGIVLPLEGAVVRQAAELADLLDDDGRTAAIVDRARQRLADSFTWERVVAQLVAGWPPTAVAA